MTTAVAPNFIRNIISTDIAANKNSGKVITRFPPEPNGYLHIGHAKSICLNFGIAEEFAGRCNLRFDDTNPEKENVEYMDSIKTDVAWLGFQWSELHNASDYFEQLYQYAVQLIEKNKAYVDSLSGDQIREYRGNLTKPGKESPYRNRSSEENLSLFKKMRAGDFKDGEHVLRARIDMNSPNINMRDPIIYRVRHSHHHQTGDQWCIYPLYDYAHCLSDAIEGITHSLCTLEFEDHRPLYDWILEQLQTPCHPQQIEFARLSLEFTVMSKRKLQELVQEKLVSGWDDPRMPTISGMRRRGYPAISIRNFCERIGVTKKDSTIEMGVLENAVREELDSHSARVMGVLRPLKVVITTWTEKSKTEYTASVHPNKPEMGTRKIPFSKTIYIEQDDFMEVPPNKFFRLSPSQEVRLRHSYIIKCNEVIKDSQGNITELHCSHDANTLGKNPEDRKVKGVIHWVAADYAIDAEVHLYDRLFKVANPAASENYTEHLNPESLEILQTAKLEPSLVNAKPGETFQFERQGYFCRDSSAASSAKLVFNRTVTLRDTWAKIGKE